MANPQLLLVEDDDWLLQGLTFQLRDAGFAVVAVTTLTEAKAQLAQRQFDIIITDIGLPDGSGLELFQSSQQDTFGKIFISSSTSEEARVEGFNSGADDYVCKPIHPEELVLRIKALLRRLSPNNDESHSTLGFLGYQLHPENRLLSCGELSCELSINEHRLLLLLIGHQGKVVNRTTLARAVDAKEHYSEGRALDILMSRLRRKLRFNDACADPIVTYRGKGYLLIERQ
ncbi:DNA-binding response regulator [Pseudidiomarina sediminum]|uniref:DNA-binding response regulator n=1 Tax=Pseudidiomarina sediminum TaxID=431675 RepID=A0A432Z2I3_9GAMM|nr:response regulator transcription factor [Pseudidiomarina sediminum]RUO72049.1 DNA-binding response regulator [Pseudidiomarina sediminum]